MVMAPMKKGASSSRTTFQVFLSFRGPDTRQGFADVLYTALMDAGIRVFRDNEEIRTGNEIGEEILKAINDSRIFVPIFSRGYASSKWCLIELVRMVENSKEESGGKKKILPIFYDVGTDDVKLETEVYRNALMEQRERFGPDAVHRWEEALKHAANIKGFELKDKGHGEFAKSFVREVSLKLKVKHTLLTDYLVHRDDQVEALLRLLHIESIDVRFVGIHGMGGIGKTTLAKVVFNKLCDRFDHSCFLADVRESSRQSNGIEKLQKQLLDSTGLASGEIAHKNDGIMRICEKLAQKKLLLVLDDIGHAEQIQYLAGDASWFGSESRIIITTRDKSVLGRKVHTLELEAMKHEEALRLFSMHAFDQDSPPNGYHSVSDEAVSSTGRLPLALEIIGSHLWNKSKKEWAATVKRLKEVPHKDVEKTLMISYEALDHGAKQIFLDIACFFVNHDIIYPMYMWEACHFDPETALKELIHMSLVKIIVEHESFGMKKIKRLWMHDQLRHMGRNIVRGESLKEAVNCSRIWKKADALEVLQAEEGIENIEMLRLIDNRYMFGGTHLCFTERELSCLRKLRYLELEGTHLSGDLKGLLSRLVWLSWRVSRKDDFRATHSCLKNLVVLNLSRSFITEDWEGWNQIKVGNKLKVLDLSNCKGLRKTPNLSNYLSLEKLILINCISLVEIDPSIGKLQCLKFLNISRCNSLRDLPRELFSLDNIEVILGGKSLGQAYYEPSFKIPRSIGRLLKLRRLSLSYCQGMGILVDALADLELLVELDLSHTDIVELPPRVGRLVELKILDLSYCREMKKLPNSIGDLRSLVELDISSSGMTELPGTIGKLKKLRVLQINNTTIQKLPTSIGMLKRLEKLSARDCRSLIEIPSTIGECTCLRSLNLGWSGVRVLPPQLPISLTKLYIPASLQTVASLNFSGVMKNPTDSSSEKRMIDIVVVEATALEVPRMLGRGGNGTEVETTHFLLSPASTLVIQRGDITKWSIDGSSDAIVNSTNETMWIGPGVDEAIHKAAGPELEEAFYNIPEVQPWLRCPTGEARITPGFDLPASSVIHTVGPIYDTDKNPEASLRSAYKNSLAIAKENNIQYIAFPAISCGCYGYPYDEAAKVAISTVKEFGNGVKEVHFVLFFNQIYDLWSRIAKELIQE